VEDIIPNLFVGKILKSCAKAMIARSDRKRRLAEVQDSQDAIAELCLDQIFHRIPRPIYFDRSKKRKCSLV